MEENSTLTPIPTQYPLHQPNGSRSGGQATVSVGALACSALIAEASSRRFEEIGTTMLVRPIACALFLLGIAPGARAAVAPPEANVQCAFAPGGGTFYLGAGHDRCWGPTNGKTMAPKFMLACAVKREDGSLSSVSFIFSEVAVSECNNGQPAT